MHLKLDGFMERNIVLIYMYFLVIRTNVLVVCIYHKNSMYWYR